MELVKVLCDRANIFTDTRLLIATVVWKGSCKFSSYSGECYWFL